MAISLFKLLIWNAIGRRNNTGDLIFDRYSIRWPFHFSSFFPADISQLFQACLGRHRARKIIESSRCFSKLSEKSDAQRLRFFLAIFLRAESFSPSNGARSFIYVRTLHIHHANSSKAYVGKERSDVQQTIIREYEHTYRWTRNWPTFRAVEELLTTRKSLSLSLSALLKLCAKSEKRSCRGISKLEIFRCEDSIPRKKKEEKERKKRTNLTARNTQVVKEFPRDSVPRS